MELVRLIKSQDRVALAGFSLFVLVLAAAGFHLLVFVQWGLFDLAARQVGLPAGAAAASLAVLALLACLIALATGALQNRFAWLRRLPGKLLALRWLCLGQAFLALTASLVHGRLALLVWLALVGLLVGLSAVLVFSLAAALVPGESRGWAAGLAVGLALALAGGLPIRWTISTGGLASALVSLAVAGGLFWLGRRAPAGLQALSRLAERPDYGRGRFVQLNRMGHPRVNSRLLLLAALLFSLYLLDLVSGLRLSLGTAGGFPGDLRLPLALAGFPAAVLAGGLYALLPEKHLYLWVFGLFALAHLLSGFCLRLAPDLLLARLGLEVFAACLYAVVNLALWMDVSTPVTVGVNVSLALAASGWMLRSLSAALTLRWPARPLPAQALTPVDAVVVLLFLILLGLTLFQRSMPPAGQPAR